MYAFDIDRRRTLPGKGGRGRAFGPERKNGEALERLPAWNRDAACPADAGAVRRRGSGCGPDPRVLAERTAVCDLRAGCFHYHQDLQQQPDGHAGGDHALQPAGNFCSKIQRPQGRAERDVHRQVACDAGPDRKGQDQLLYSVYCRHGQRPAEGHPHRAGDHPDRGGCAAADGDVQRLPGQRARGTERDPVLHALQHRQCRAAQHRDQERRRLQGGAGAAVPVRGREGDAHRHVYHGQQGAGEQAVHLLSGGGFQEDADHFRHGPQDHHRRGERA